jgi:hypothetical protein
MIFKIILQTLKNIIKLTEVFKMFDSNSNPDAPVSGNWLANTYTPQQVTAPVYHTVGYSINPFGNGADLSRRNMVNNPAYMGQPVLQPQQTQVQPFSTYPPSSVPTPTLNQFVQNSQNSGNTAAMSQNNPWANLNNPTTPVAPVLQQPTVNAWGYQMPSVTPTVSTTDIINSACSWDKKAGSWNIIPQQNLQAPLINWNQYGTQPAQSGCYAPLNTPTVQPQYPSSFVTTPVNTSWTTICETNFKTQY